jgi:hypothetical protein
MHYYSDNLIGIKLDTLPKIITSEKEAASQGIYERFKEYSIDQIIPNIETLDTEAKAILLEEALIDGLLRDVDTNDKTDPAVIIIDYFEYYLSAIPEPINQLSAVYNPQIIKKKGRPRKEDKTDRFVGPLKAAEIKQYQKYLDENQGNTIIFVHNIYSTIDSNTNYASATEKGRFRLLNSDNVAAGWRDMEEKEFTVYYKFVQLIKLEKKENVLGGAKIYLEYRPKGVIVLVNKSDEDTEAVKTDGRKRKGGKAFKSYKKDELIFIADQIKVLEEDFFGDKTDKAALVQVDESWDTQDYLDNKVFIDKILDMFPEFEEELEDPELWPVERFQLYYKVLMASKFTNDMLAEIITNALIRLGWVNDLRV